MFLPVIEHGPYLTVIRAQMTHFEAEADRFRAGIRVGFTMADGASITAPNTEVTVALVAKKGASAKSTSWTSSARATAMAIIVALSSVVIRLGDVAFTA